MCYGVDEEDSLSGFLNWFPLPSAPVPSGKASASRAIDTEIKPGFPRSSHTSDLRSGIIVTTCQAAVLQALGKLWLGLWLVGLLVA